MDFSRRERTRLLRKIDANKPMIGIYEWNAATVLIEQGVATSRAKSEAGTGWWLDLTASGRAELVNR